MEERYNYYWYYHLAMSFEQADAINRAIENHNWEAFLIAKECYENEPFVSSQDGEIMIFFPNHISHTIGADFTESIDLNEETFNLITYAEYECG